MAVFVLCWLPFYALNIVNLLVVLPDDFRGLYFFVVVLSYANSCANPILYGFLSDNFKRGFRKALCRASRRVNNDNDRAATELQRPTEEWGGIALQPPKSEGVTDDGGGESEGEERESNGTTGAVQMTEIRKVSQNGNGRGVAEGSRAPASQPGKAEAAQPGQSAKHGETAGKGRGCAAAEGPSTLAAKVKSGTDRTQTNAFTDDKSVLEISYL